ncbi:hypothetical protein HN51_050377 [Arachis hypogaea]
MAGVANDAVEEGDVNDEADPVFILPKDAMVVEESSTAELKDELKALLEKKPLMVLGGMLHANSRDLRQFGNNDEAMRCIEDDASAKGRQRTSDGEATMTDGGDSSRHFPPLKAGQKNPNFGF